MRTAHQKPGPGKEPMRRCHDCGKPSWNYRCDDCWRKVRLAFEDDDDPQNIPHVLETATLPGHILDSLLLWGE